MVSRGSLDDIVPDDEVKKHWCKGRDLIVTWIPCQVYGKRGILVVFLIIILPSLNVTVVLPKRSRGIVGASVAWFWSSVMYLSFQMSCGEHESRSPGDDQVRLVQLVQKWRGACIRHNHKKCVRNVLLLLHKGKDNDGEFIVEISISRKSC